MRSCLRIMLLVAVTVQGYGAFQTRYRPSTYALYGWSEEEKLITGQAARRWSPLPLLEAGLLASGADSQEQIRKLTRVYEQAWQHIRNETRQLRDPALLAPRVLELLHTTLYRRYHETRTTLIHVLETGDYNCVSSALLYNHTLERLGLTTRAVTVPGHVYSLVLVRGRWIEVETTHRHGYNPLRQPLPADRAGGRLHIPDKGDPQKKQYLDNRYFTTLIYYNRGTLAFHDPDPLVPVALFVKALLIHPGHTEAEENLLAVFTRWITQAVRGGDTDLALVRIEEAKRALGPRPVFHTLMVQAHEEGAALAVKRDDFKEVIRILQRLRILVVDRDGSMLRQVQGYYAQWAQYLLQQQKHDDMLQVINGALEKWPSPFLENFKVHLISHAAQHFFAQGNPAGGVLFYNRNLPYLNESRAMLLNRHHLYNEWGKYELAKGRHEKAYDAYRYALMLYQGGQLFLTGKGEVIRQWVGTLIREKKPGEWPLAVWELFRKYSDSSFLQELHKPFLTQLETMLKTRDFAAAYAVLEKLRIQVSHIPGLLDVDRELIRVIGEWGRHTLQQRVYRESIRIFKSGLIRYPGRDEFLAGLKQAYSVLARQLLDRGQYAEARQLLKEALFHFPDHQALQKMAAYFPEK